MLEALRDATLMLTFPFFLLQILYISLLTSGASARVSSATTAFIRPVIDYDEDDDDGDAIVNMKQLMVIFGVVIYICSSM